MKFFRRLFRWTLHLSIGCVLLDAAMPLVAVAVSHARGVPLAHLCHLYGVVIPGQTASPHEDAYSAKAPAHAAPGAASESHGDAGSPTDRDDCALRGLVAQAAGGQPTLGATLRAPADGRATVPAVLPHHGSRDAVACWVSALAHSPPRLS